MAELNAALAELGELHNDMGLLDTDLVNAAKTEILKQAFPNRQLSFCTAKYQVLTDREAPRALPGLAIYQFFSEDFLTAARSFRTTSKMPSSAVWLHHQGQGLE